MSLVKAQGAMLNNFSRRSEMTFACIVDTQTEVPKFLNHLAVGMSVAVFTASVVKMEVNLDS